MGTIKKVIMGDDARLGLLKGMEIVAKTVGATAGSAGRNACIANQWGSPSLTKDGYKTSKSIELAGIEGEGVKLIQEAAEKQNQEAGDATTLVTTLTYEIAKEGIKYMEKGCNATMLKKGIDIATDDIVDILKQMSKPITTNDEVKQLATISANGDNTIGSLIAEAVEKVGNTGVITAEDSKDFNTVLEIAEGLQFDNGFVSGYFMTNPEKSLVEFDKPLLLLTDYKINTLKQILPILEGASQAGRPLVIISEDVDNDALSALIMNHLKGTLKCCVVKAPSFGDFRQMEMEDIATLTGGQYISEKLGVNLTNLNVEVLGSCDKIKITPNKTVIIGGDGDKEALASKIEEIKEKIVNTESNYDKVKYEERLAKLTGGIAIIKVGGKSETEMNEKKDRIEDAICSTKSALEEGILPGGGTSLVRASQSIEFTNGKLRTPEDDENELLTLANIDPSSVKVKPSCSQTQIDDIKKGYEIMKKAILRQIVLLAKNSGVSGDVVLEGVLSQLDNLNVGYDLMSGEYVDMFQAGIVDATKCIRLAVETASSVAGALLTTESVVLPDIDEAIKMSKLMGASAPQF